MRESMALFWFDAKAGIEFFQFYKRWKRFFKFVSRSFPVFCHFWRNTNVRSFEPAVWRRKNTNKFNLMSRVQKRCFGQFYRKYIQKRKFEQFYKYDNPPPSILSLYIYIYNSQNCPQAKRSFQKEEWDDACNSIKRWNILHPTSG